MRHFEFSLSTSIECIKKYSSQTFEFDLPGGMPRTISSNGIIIGLSDYARSQMECLLTSDYAIGLVERIEEVKQ